MNRFFLLVIAVIVFLSGCKNNNSVPDKNAAFEKELQEKFIKAQEGDIIELPEGTFFLSRSLVLDGVKNVTIKGSGTGKTILSFKRQMEGAEGLKITATGVTLEDFAVVDTKGNAVKIQDANNVTFRRIKAGWNSLQNPNNGAYGLYPVGCTSVLIEDCEVSGASDAGIYINQSKNIIIRKNHVHDNMVGIEIENSTDADAYENLSENNSSGLLVFALPDLPRKSTSRYRIFNNRIYTNNAANYVAKGNVASEIPAGSGIVIIAGGHGEVFNNDFSGQNTFSLAVISYSSLNKTYNDSLYNPYCGGISIHDNKIARGTGSADVNGALGKLLAEICGTKTADIVYDGVVNPAGKNTDGSPKESERICMRNNGNIVFSNLDVPGKGKNRSNDISKFNCGLTPLLEIKLNQ